MPAHIEAVKRNVTLVPGGIVPVGAVTARFAVSGLVHPLGILGFITRDAFVEAGFPQPVKTTVQMPTKIALLQTFTKRRSKDPSSIPTEYGERLENPWSFVAAPFHS